MFIIEKRNGKGIIRPMFIGRIKNNAIRRTLCAITYPLTILVTVAVNMTVALSVGVISSIAIGCKTIADVEPIYLYSVIHQLISH
ncbi:hypothetical protein I3271_05490 [Photobacterium leiognathi]|uniref:hypothetical protein n=1 Tax=Photobacterium leiognathi TaxID=553611 RepID=UPI001EDEE6E8|nr:hypothetical protein [Photobacterium leiognathi]MCG3884134.1 hypothetical protein [Photobacterium leiognathi]